MTGDDRPGDQLEHECVVFLRYLTGRDPNPALRAAYARAHRDESGQDEEWAADAEDDPLVAFARHGYAPCRLADTFATVSDRDGPLRRKFLLLLALLSRDVDAEPLRPRGRSTASLLRGTAIAALVSVGAFLLACLILGPIWLVAGRRRAEEAP
jgi:hypothetical protein